MPALLSQISQATYEAVDIIPVAVANVGEQVFLLLFGLDEGLAGSLLELADLLELIDYLLGPSR